MNVLYDEKDLLDRAEAAYFRGNALRDTPSRSSSDVFEDDAGKVTITLRNVNGMLARYRWNQETDRLRRLATKDD